MVYHSHEHEFDYKWRGIPPNREQAKQFLHELRTLGGKIRGEHDIEAGGV